MTNHAEFCHGINLEPSETNDTQDLAALAAIKNSVNGGLGYHVNVRLK